MGRCPAKSQTPGRLVAFCSLPLHQGPDSLQCEIERKVEKPLRGVQPGRVQGGRTRLTWARLL